MTEPSGRARDGVGVAQPLLAAVVLTALNALKPLHVDDTAFFYVARQMAHDPLRPYGFEAFWGDAPVSGNAVLAPAGLPAWWAIGMRALGDEPFLWKLWLLPLALLLACALHDLLRRFARGLEVALLWGTLLSPVILPGFNLMLDVPALALGLGAFALFLRACDGGGGSAIAAIAAGALLAWAAQTKYSAILLAPTIAIAALVRRTPWRAIAPLTTAFLLFVGWETLVAVQHGASHFLLHASNLHGHDTRDAQLRLVLPLITLLGGVGSATTLVGMAGLAWPGLGVAVVALAWIGALASFALVPPDLALFVSRSPFLTRTFGPLHAVLAVLGGLALVVWLAAAVKLLPLRLAERARGGAAAARPDDLVVVAWLVLEITGAVVLSPYAAVRRVLGPVVAATVVVGRLASGARGSDRRWLVVAACALSALIGCALYLTDLLEARAIERGVELAASRIDEVDRRPERRVWFAGHWGFQFYAERRGMRGVVPGRSHLEPGDWLVVPDAHIDRQAFAVDGSWAELHDTIVIDDGWPWTTLSTFYAGISPLEGRSAPRLRVDVYRVAGEVVPVAP